MMYVYRIARAETSEGLCQLVTELINNDWELVGGVNYDRMNYPAQALVKDVSQEPALLKPRVKIKPKRKDEDGE